MDLNAFGHLDFGDGLQPDRLTCLMAAVLGNRVAVTRLLCDHGVDVNAADQHGRTALHHAAGGASVEVLDMLCHHGADCRVEDQVCVWRVRVCVPLACASVVGRRGGGGGGRGGKSGKWGR